MTIEEAIKHCMDIAETQEMCSNGKKCAEEHRQLAEWLKDYMRLLEQQPCEDAISRQAVLEGLRTCYDTETKEYSNGSQWINYEDAVAEMENLPSVTSQPKTGYWVLADEQNKEDVENDNYRFICSECQYSDIHAKGTIVPYCWKCGAKMVEPQKSEVQDADSN